MEKTTIDIGNDRASAGEFTPLSAPLGTSNVAINYYRRTCGEPIVYCYHRHHEQEEIFYVLSGTATFETEDGIVSVDSGELIRFAPGEWQRGMNRERESLEVLALGAPREQGPTDLRRDCPNCETKTPVEATEVEDAVVFYCDVCVRKPVDLPDRRGERRFYGSPRASQCLY